MYSFYSQAILPMVAALFSKDKAAYHYLPGSIAEFPSGEEMKINNGRKWLFIL